MVTQQEEVDNLLDEVYPQLTWSMVIWIVIAAGVLVLVSLALTFGQSDNPLLATLITLVSGGLLLSVCITGFILQSKTRIKIREYAIGVGDYNGCYVVYRNISSAPIDYVVRGLEENYTLVADLASKLRKALPTAKISPEALLPVTFVTFKDEGEVTMEFNGVARKVRGVQRDRWIEVENLGEYHTMISLIQHELAHVLLSDAFPQWGMELQHKAMAEAGIA